MQQALIRYMNRQKKIISVLLAFMLMLSVCSCGGGGGSAEASEDPNAPDRDNTPVVLKTEAPGDKTFGNSDATIDYSNVDKGYFMAQYTGSNSKVKMQVFIEDVTYSYDLSTNGNWVAFPLSLGDGEYTVGVFENISDDQYAQLFKESFSVKLDDDFGPFLHPNQFVDFDESTKAVAMSEDICKGAKSDLGAVERLFNYVTDNITYDYDKAATVKPGYLPDIDETIQTGKGICFDYAAVLSSMLRVQRIPCKLVIGYADDAYHSWISIYTADTGWVDNMIEFHEDTWTRMDPTFAAAGDDSDPNLVGSGTEYNPNFFY